MHYASLCAIVKDEDRDIHEWLAYHFATGFEHVLIYDNNSRIPLRTTLADHVSAGLVTVVDWPLTRAQQLSAYHHALRTWGKNTSWLAFIDVDEFILPLQHDDIRDFLDEYGDCGAVGAHWAMFGSGGRISRPHGGILANYTQSLGLDPHIKSIVRPAQVLRPVSAHHFAFRPGAFCVNEDRVPIGDFMSYPLGDKLRINHYYYKSQQDFQDKIARGLVTQMKGGAERRLQNFYDHLDEPSFPDTRILRLLPKMQQFLDLPAWALAAEVRRAAEPDVDALARDMALALENDELDEALRKGRILSRRHEGLDLARLGQVAAGAPDRLARMKDAITAKMRRPDLPTAELRRCYEDLAAWYGASGRPEVARAIGEWLG
ncbi:MAG: glycosyltransferase family 92 protein [Desulfovibrio sp.]|nr:glycosyltransferase family 92 protein [Desulfovibrio sp.]